MNKVITIELTRFLPCSRGWEFPSQRQFIDFDRWKDCQWIVRGGLTSLMHNLPFLKKNPTIPAVYHCGFNYKATVHTRNFLHLKYAMLSKPIMHSCLRTYLRA